LITLSTCFSGPKAKSQDFLIISRLDSLSLVSSVPFCPADWLYPGGLTLSVDFSCLFLKDKKYAKRMIVINNLI